MCCHIAELSNHLFFPVVAEFKIYALCTNDCLGSVGIPCKAVLEYHDYLRKKWCWCISDMIKLIA